MERDLVGTREVQPEHAAREVAAVAVHELDRELGLPETAEPGGGHDLAERNGGVTAIGARDRLYDAEHVDRLQAPGRRVLVFEDASHSLALGGDLPCTLAILPETVEAIGEFVDRPA